MLEEAANAHSIDMSDHATCIHNSTNGTLWYVRIQQYGYAPHSGLGENVACGFLTPEDVFNGWMSSPGHRDNMLGSYAHVGVGYYHDYWTMDLGKPAPSTPPPCSLAHDFNSNGVIGIGDIEVVSQRWSSSQTYDPMYDLNLDQTINVIDVMMVSAEWGMTCQ
jgi:hypothetical protein